MLQTIRRLFGAIAAAVAAVTCDGYAKQYGDRVEREVPR